MQIDCISVLLVFFNLEVNIIILKKLSIDYNVRLFVKIIFSSLLVVSSNLVILCENLVKIKKLKSYEDTAIYFREFL